MIIILKQDDIGINHATRKRNCRDQDVSREDLGGVGGKPEPGWVGRWVGGGHNMLCNDKDYGDATY